MNPYLSILGLAAQIIDHHTQIGQPAPPAATTVLQQGIALLAAFESAQSGLVKVDSGGSAIADFQTGVAALVASGVQLPAAVQPYVADIQKFTATTADFESGQAAFMGSFPYSNEAHGIVGKTGHAYAVLAGSVGESALIGAAQ
jgi:hypothetical protein